MEGGQVAITGFIVQVAIALLDALATKAAWNTFTVEPTSTTDEFEKVDILWHSTAVEKHIQVKHSTRTFTPSKVRAWCDEIKSRGAAAELHLVLVGVPSGDMRVEETIDGVQVAVRSPNVGDLLDACSHRFAVMGESLGYRVTAEGAATAVRTLAGRLLVEAATGRTWSRVEFIALVVSTVPSAAPPTSAAPIFASGCTAL